MPVNAKLAAAAANGTIRAGAIPNLAAGDAAPLYELAKRHMSEAILMGEWAPFVDMPLGLGVGVDPKDPTIYSAGASQGGLGIGNRDYYLVQGAILMIGLTYVVVNFMTDFFYSLANPRIRQ